MGRREERDGIWDLKARKGIDEVAGSITPVGKYHPCFVFVHSEGAL